MAARISFSREEVQVVYMSLKPSVHGVDLVWRFSGLFHDLFISKNSPKTYEVELSSSDLWSIQDAVPVAAGTKNQPDAGLQVHLKVISGLMESAAVSEVAAIETLLEEVRNGDARKGHHKASRGASDRASASV